MSKLYTKLAVAATAVAVPLAMGLTAASASTPSFTPPAGSVFSPEQFAYRVTGSNFKAARETFNVPNAAAFAGNIGAFGISTQLWSANNVVVLGLSDTTTSSPWSPGLAIFDTITHAVICAEATCGVPSTWTAGLSYPTGDNVTESLGYNAATGNLGVQITDHTNPAKSTLFYHHVGGGILYNQVRLGAEVGVTPWSGNVAYSPPGAVRGVATLTGVSLTNTAGRTGSISSALWRQAPVTWTRNGLSSGGVNGVVGRLTSGGTSFIPFLTP